MKDSDDMILVLSDIQAHYLKLRFDTIQDTHRSWASAANSRRETIEMVEDAIARGVFDPLKPRAPFCERLIKNEESLGKSRTKESL